MRIAIDARAYGWAGIGRYTRNLLKGLASVAADRYRFVVLTGGEHVAQARRDLPQKNFSVVEVDDSYYGWREQTIFWRQLMKVRADLWHFTHFNVPILFNRPFVVTIHDTTRFVFPGQTQQGLAKQIAYEYVFKHAVERARAAICVSTATKDALNELPVQSPRLVVIPEAVEEAYHQPIAKHDRERARMLVGSSAPYVLYVGVWMGHKNLPRLLAAFSKVREKHPELLLVMTGRPRPGYVPVDKLARNLGLTNEQVLYLGHVPEELLPALYAEAKCLALPSLYEGFGLPALEAKAGGTPVVASGVTSLPEVLGEAYFVNPEYGPSVAEGIERAIAAPHNVRAMNWSWDEVAQETLRVYAAAK